MNNFTLILDFLAPVPTNHRVRIDYFNRNVGVFGANFQLDQEHPVVTDLETGIRYAEAEHFRAWRTFTERPPNERPHASTFFGKVMSCEVVSHTGDHAGIYTRLVVAQQHQEGAPEGT